MMNTTSILLIDDHAMVRKGMRMLLESNQDFTIVGEAGSMREATEVATRTQPQIITLDISLPGQSGLSGIEQLRTAAPNARIVVVTMHDDPAYVRSAIAMGAVGFVNKSAADTELVAAIRAVARGRIFIGASSGGESALVRTPRLRDGKPTPLDTLSEREREILRGVARGTTNQRLADDLSLSVKTVESYRARVMKKLGLKDRADLVRVALEAGFLADKPENTDMTP